MDTGQKMGSDGGCYLTVAAMQVETCRARIPLQELTSRCPELSEVDTDTRQRPGLR